MTVLCYSFAGFERGHCGAALVVQPQGTAIERSRRDALQSIGEQSRKRSGVDGPPHSTKFEKTDRDAHVDWQSKHFCRQSERPSQRRTVPTCAGAGRLVPKLTKNEKDLYYAMWFRGGPLYIDIAEGPRDEIEVDGFIVPASGRPGPAEACGKTTVLTW